MLRLRAFGGLRLEGPAGIISSPGARPKPLAVLAVIAAAGRQGISRERVVGLLWSDVPEDQARHALAQVLYSLRKDLGVPELLEPSTPLLRLNSQLISSDLDDFRDAGARGDRRTALSVYTGPFLDGFYLAQAPGFETWVEEERARLAREFRRMLAQEAAELEQSGERRAAIEHWRRLVAEEPLATEPRLRLMRALEALGEPGAALDEARIHAELMDRELGAAAAPEVSAMAARLRQPVPMPLPVAVPLPIEEHPPESGAPAPRRRRLGTVIVALLAVAAVGAILMRSRTRAEPPVVAVGLLESHLPNDTLGIARTLADLLTTHLMQVPGLPVIGRARLLEVLGSAASEPAPGVLSRAARTAGADELVEGVLYPDPAGFRLDLRRTRLADGRASGAVSITGKDPVSLTETAVASLVEHWGLERPAEPLRAVTSVSLLARRFYDEGLRVMYAGDARAASDLFRVALLEDSTFAMAAYYLARTMSEPAADSMGGRWRQAMRLAERATDRERLQILAHGTLILNDARGLAFAETLAVRYPGDLDGIRMLGEQRFARGDFDAAVDAFERVMMLDSAGRQGRSARCHACEAGDQAIWAALTGDSLARAERIAREMMQWRVGDVTGASLLVTVLLRDGRLAEAVAQARAVAGRGPWVSVEAVEMDTLHYAGALPVIDSMLSAQLAVARRPEQRSAILERLIFVRRESGKLRSSLRLAAELAGMVPRATARTEPFVHLQRALTLLELGRSDRGAALAAAALFDSMSGMPGYDEPRMARHRAWMWTHQATALARAGDTAALPALAARIAEVAARSSYGRDRRLPRFIEGLLREARGDWEGARIEYAASVWSPTENLAAARLANAALRTGRYGEAITVLEAYLRGPLDAANQYVSRWEVHRLLAEAYAREGRSDRTRAHQEWVRRALARAEPRFEEAATSLPRIHQPAPRAGSLTHSGGRGRRTPPGSPA